MPDKTPMKMQWITVDGRQTPIVLPQIWNHEKQDWEVTSDQNRLPVDARLTGSNLEDGIPVEISGNLVTDLNGYKAMRTKQEALAYKTWFLGDQEVVTVAGGSRFEETSPVLINGFSTISFISRAQDYSRHDYQIRLRWQSVGHGVNGPFSYQEDFDVESDQFNSNVTETKAEYVLGSIMNHDSESHEYHVAFLLRV